MAGTSPAMTALTRDTGWQAHPANDANPIASAAGMSRVRLEEARDLYSFY
jgi:hypothetical protein